MTQASLERINQEFQENSIVPLVNHLKRLAIVMSALDPSVILSKKNISCEGYKLQEFTYRLLPHTPVELCMYTPLKGFSLDDYYSFLPTHVLSLPNQHLTLTFGRCSKPDEKDTEQVIVLQSSDGRPSSYKFDMDSGSSITGGLAPPDLELLVQNLEQALLELTPTSIEQ